MMAKNLDSAVAAARALGHPARLRILAMLGSGELCACQITEVIELAPSTVSAHVKELRRAGLVQERKDGKWVFFRLVENPVSRTWIETSLAAAADDQQLAADARLVRELRALPIEDLCRLGFDAARSRAAARP
jgi:DNA-binding transcriptional ArsR family regulator